MKNFLKRTKQPFPQFPPKYPLRNLVGKFNEEFLKRRIEQLNAYFDELYQRFPQKVPYTYSLTDLCTPFKLNVGVIGDFNVGKSSLV